MRQEGTGKRGRFGSLVLIPESAIKEPVDKHT